MKMREITQNCATFPVSFNNNRLYTYQLTSYRMKPLILLALFVGFVVSATAQVSKTFTPGLGKDLYILSRQQVPFSGYRIQHSIANNSAGINDPNRVLGTNITYIFTGNGNYDNPANWFNNNMPPVVLPSGSEIDINPITGGQCVLNIPQTVNPGATFQVFANASLVIQSSLTLN
jgi:hypothetical protein